MLDVLNVLPENYPIWRLVNTIPFIIYFLLISLALIFGFYYGLYYLGKKDSRINIAEIPDVLKITGITFVLKLIVDRLAGIMLYGVGRYYASISDEKLFEFIMRSSFSRSLITSFVLLILGTIVYSIIGKFIIKGEDIKARKFRVLAILLITIILLPFKYYLSYYGLM